MRISSKKSIMHTKLSVILIKERNMIFRKNKKNTLTNLSKREQIEELRQGKTRTLTGKEEKATIFIKQEVLSLRMLETFMSITLALSQKRASRNERKKKRGKNRKMMRNGDNIEKSSGEEQGNKGISSRVRVSSESKLIMTASLTMRITRSTQVMEVLTTERNLKTIGIMMVHFQSNSKRSLTNIKRLQRIQNSISSETKGSNLEKLLRNIKNTSQTSNLLSTPNKETLIFSELRSKLREIISK